MNYCVVHELCYVNAGRCSHWSVQRWTHCGGLATCIGAVCTEQRSVGVRRHLTDHGRCPSAVHYSDPYTVLGYVAACVVSEG
jgi:hypothetical protein